MVNGRTLEEELNRIELFFENMSEEEFGNMLIDCGMDCIDDSYKGNYVLACESPLFTEQKYINKITGKYSDEFMKDFAPNGQDTFLGAA